DCSRQGLDRVIGPAEPLRQDGSPVFQGRQVVRIDFQGSVKVRKSAFRVRVHSRQAAGHPAAIDHLDYDAFGNVTNETNGTNGDRYKWTGRELDSATGLQYNRARFYQPSVGRFSAEDPIGFAGGDVDLYRYARNNPTNASDPSG